MNEERIKILSAFFYNCRKANDFRPGAHNDHQLQIPVFFPIRIIHYTTPFLRSEKRFSERGLSPIKR